jgi:hypothetical protein
MHPRVYVCGASAELERAERVIAELRLRGVEVTFDWCAEIRRHQALGIPDSAIDDIGAYRIAMADLHAVGRAHAVLLLAPEKPTIGAWVELGYAAALHRTIIVSGPANRCSLFTRIAHLLIDTDDDALDAIAPRPPARVES